MSDTSDEYLRSVTVGDPQPLTTLINVVDYEPQWPVMYEELASNIRATLGNTLIDIAHVGSTSVPGLAAKPIIDIDLSVPDSARETEYVPALETLGYQLRIREPQWHEHRCLKRSNPHVNLHVFSPNAEPALRNLVFRDWLRAHPQDRALYAETKRQLAQRQWKYVQNYADAKTEVVTTILAAAGYQYDGESLHEVSSQARCCEQ